MKRTLRRLLPFLDWLPLRAEHVRADLLAGLTVALVLVPQSMAYAQLAGLPPYYGLYAAFLPVLVGALWGSSPQLATGPVAVVSLLTASSLSHLAAPGTGQFIAYAVLLALIVGAIQFALGLFRLGAIVNLLSHPVIIGFTNAAAIIIGLSQLGALLGVPMSRSDSFLADIAGVLQQAGDTHWPTLAMGLSALVLMLLARRYRPKWPNVLIAVVLTTLVSWQFGFARSLDAPLESIRNEQASRLVYDYLALGVDIGAQRAHLDERRAALRALRAQGTATRIRIVALESEVELLRLQLEEAAREHAARRQSLRQLDFIAADDPPGHLVLYLAEAAPAAVADGPRWRIRDVDARGLRLAGRGRVVGAIPAGLPDLALPRLDWSALTQLLSAALVIALVGFMEAISIAKAIAAKTRIRIDPNRELIGQGLANITASVSQSFPVSGSVSRSAVNLNAGAVTGLSSVFSGLLVLVTLLFLTPLLYHLPQSVLAAVIMLAVVSLINFKALLHAWQIHRHDGLAAVATFVATLAFAPHLDMGILFGVMVAIGLFLHRRMRPRVEILAWRPDDPATVQDAGEPAPIEATIVPVRFEGALIFVNVAYFEDSVLEALARFPKARAILIVGSGINEIDVSGAEMIGALAERLQQSGVALCLCSLRQPVIEVLARSDVGALITPERIFRNKEEAMRVLRQRYAQAAA